MASGTVRNPKIRPWLEYLGKAAELSGKNYKPHELEVKAKEKIASFSNLNRSCEVSLGDYAVMLMLKDSYESYMVQYVKMLESKKEDLAFQYGFWEAMRSQMANSNFPMGAIEVTDEEVELRLAFKEEYILTKYPDPGEARNG